ncbi:HET-domain-containing protein, partial [Lepidopterella palustris CBS 459.81]
STESAASIHQIANWIKQCLRSHSNCPNEPTSFLPHRVLQIRNGEEVPRVKLIETENQTRTAAYICLSHCWGSLRPGCMTTSKNLESHKTDIPWSSLSKTFQDAVAIAIRLGFEYLWIDSLCIIQDDLMDWQNEAANMAEIYRNGFLTIAATASHDGTGGLFRPIAAQHEAQSAFVPGFDRPIYCRQILVHPGLAFSEDSRWLQDISHYRDMFPLLERGWFYQERILSPRIVHFTLCELFWECSQESCCECQTGASSVACFYPPKHAHDSLSSNRDTTEASISWNWHDIVEEYTAKQLTFEKDKLPAISGIAKVLGFRLQGSTSYLGGLWAATISQDLVWRCLQPSTRPSESYAPSWSWAS